MTKGELFSTPMVQAYLENRKKHTVRPVKAKSPYAQYQLDECTTYRSLERAKELSTNGVTALSGFWEPGKGMVPYRPPKFRSGDYMYVRETWAHETFAQYEQYFYKADGENPAVEKWRPSIHMPKEAARLFFKVTKVEVMRLEDVTEEFAREDGFQNDPHCTAKAKFIGFWLDTYGPDACWMWVYWTEPCSREEAEEDGRA